MEWVNDNVWEIVLPFRIIQRIQSASKLPETQTSRRFHSPGNMLSHCDKRRVACKVAVDTGDCTL
jgi:hypothetical protein